MRSELGEVGLDVKLVYFVFASYVGGDNESYQSSNRR